MTCERCERVALYRVGAQGFCAAHRNEAEVVARASSADEDSRQRARVREFREIGRTRRTGLYRAGSWVHR